MYVGGVMRDSYKQLVYILQNHSTEEALLNIQLQEAREQMDRGLERIYTFLGISGIDYDTIKVQVSISSADGKLVNALTACDKIRDSYALKTSRIQQQLNQIQEVYNQILELDQDEKNVLIALYYPRRKIFDAARILHCSKATVYRMRDMAVQDLFVVCSNKGII